MKRINNCKIKELFPWIWDRFDSISMTEFEKTFVSLRLNRSHTITFNYYELIIKNAADSIIYGTVSNKILTHHKELISDFLRLLLLDRELQNKEIFDCICNFMSSSDLHILNSSISEKVKCFFFPYYSIQEEVNGDIKLVVKFWDRPTTESFLVVVFDHCYGSVLSYRFETTNYRVSWNQTEGTEAQKQFYKMMNNLLISEMKTRIQ